MTLPEGHISVVCRHFQRIFTLKPPCQFHLNFICSLQAKTERKFIFGLGHMTKMANIPIYGENVKKNLFKNIKADCLKACAASREFLKDYMNDDPGLSLTYFLARLNLVP